MANLPKSGAAELVLSQAVPETSVNEIARHLDAGFSRVIIEDRSLTSPPGSCVDGACYLIAATASGAWLGKDGRLAKAVGTNASNGWIYSTVAVEGFRLYVTDEDLEIIYNGSAWVSVSVSVSDTAYGSGWNGDTGVAPSKNAVYDKIESLLPGGGSSGLWALAGLGQTSTGIWDFAVDGAKANVDFNGLSGYNELLIVLDAVTGSAGTANRTIRVSTDNGSTFYSTSGDYVQLSATGAVTNLGSCAFLSSATSSAATTAIQIRNTKGPTKFITSITPGNILFRASSSDITAIRVTTTTADTMNGGKIYVLGR